MRHRPGQGRKNCPSDHGRWNMSLSKSEKDRIRQLKAMGHSDRKIAQTTGHSRNTVADVLARPIDGDADNDARRREREARRQLAALAAREVPWLRPQGHVSVVPLYGPQLLGTRRLRGEVRPREIPIDRRMPPGYPRLSERIRARYQDVRDRNVRRGEIPWER